jgi:hypothetical protein
MANRSVLNKKTKVTLTVVSTLLIILGLFVFRSYLKENFDIGADTISSDSTERLLLSKTVTGGDFASDTLSNTKISDSKIVLITNGTDSANATATNPIKGTITGNATLTSGSYVSKVVLGSSSVDSSCTLTDTKVSVSEDGSSWSDWYDSTSSSLTIGSKEAISIKYVIALSSCSSNYTPGITSLSVFGYKNYNISLPPTPADPTTSATTSATPPVPTIPTTVATPPSPNEPTTTATTTTVAASSAFGTAGSSAKTIALGSIQSGVPFWLIVLIVALIGTLISYRIIKQK